MAIPARAQTHLSISFSPEELAVLAADLGHDPRRAGVSLPERWTRQERELALEVATRSLRSRRVMTGNGPDRQVAYAVAVLVDVVCAPAVRVEVHAPVSVRFLAQAEATVRAREVGGLYEFTPFATTDLLRWVAIEVGLTDEAAGPGEPLELSAQSYLDLRLALRDRALKDAALKDAALTDRAASVIALPSGLAAALALRQDRALSVRRRDDRGRVIGGELAWVGDRHGLWSVPTIDQPMAGEGQGVGGSAIVRIEPVSAQGILDTLAGFVRDEP